MNIYSCIRESFAKIFQFVILHKPRRAQRRRKVNTQEGTYLVNRDEKKIQKVRPVEGTDYHKIMAISGAGR